MRIEELDRTLHTWERNQLWTCLHFLKTRSGVLCWAGSMLILLKSARKSVCPIWWQGLTRQHCGLIIHEYSWIGRRQCYLSLMSLNSRKCVTTDIDLDSFTEWWRYIIWWNLTIWCWSIICWFFIFYIISSHKTKITLLYKKINFMTFQHMMTFHHIPYDGISTFLYYNVWWDFIIYWCLSTMDLMIPINYTIS